MVKLIEFAVLQRPIRDPSWLMGHIRTPNIRREGWTAEHQLRFLDALTQTRSISKSAAAAGTSHESAYRLRDRRGRRAVRRIVGPRAGVLASAHRS